MPRTALTPRALPFDEFAARCAARAARVPSFAPKPVTSPAMLAAFAKIDANARRLVFEVSKERARAYLDPRTRWQLDMIYGGCRFGSPALTACSPEEGLERLRWCLRQPSYGHRVARLNIRGARLAFRWQRRFGRA